MKLSGLLTMVLEEMKRFHGNGLHIGGRLLEILHLDVETDLEDPLILILIYRNLKII